MYERSAELYDQLYHFKDYGKAVEGLRELVGSHRPGARSWLDVACSTGRHLERLQHHYDVAGLDISPDLLAQARQRCPEVPLHEADMMDFDLDRTFDVVSCLFASIAYTKTTEGLTQAIACMARHLAPNGLLVVEPWLTPEQYWTEHIVLNTAEDPERKVAWMYVGTVDGTVVTNDIEFMVGTPTGVSRFTERHQMGLFTREDYDAAMGAAGLEIIHSDDRGFFGNGLHVATNQS